MIVLVLFFIISLFFFFRISPNFPGNQGIPKGMENPIPVPLMLTAQRGMSLSRAVMGWEELLLFCIVRKAAPGPQIKAARTREEGCPAG